MLEDQNRAKKFVIPCTTRALHAVQASAYEAGALFNQGNLEILGAGGATFWGVDTINAVNTHTFNISGITLTIATLLPGIVLILALIKLLSDWYWNRKAKKENKDVNKIKPSYTKAFDTFVLFFLQCLGAGGATAFFLGLCGVAAVPALIAATVVFSLACLQFAIKKYIGINMDKHFFGIGFVLTVAGAGGAMHWLLASSMLAGFIGASAATCFILPIACMVLAGIFYLYKNYNRYKNGGYKQHPLHSCLFSKKTEKTSESFNEDQTSPSPCETPSKLSV